MSDSSEDSDSECDMAFATLDMNGVEFDVRPESSDDAVDEKKFTATMLSIDKKLGFGDYSFESSEYDAIPVNLRTLGRMLADGDYAGALRSSSAKLLFGDLKQASAQNEFSVADFIRQNQMKMIDSPSKFLEVEMLGVAALNLFLQANYTGPSLSEEEHYAALSDVNPHACFIERLRATTSTSKPEETKEERLTAPKRHVDYQNSVLAELSVEGEWPCQVCVHPYFLLLARSILLPLADPSSINWTQSYAVAEQKLGGVPPPIQSYSKRLRSACLWSARAAIAHERLLQSRQPSANLFQEVERFYQAAVTAYCVQTQQPDQTSATIYLEYGLAEHHFERPGKGKKNFIKAKECSGLLMNVTGAMGKRTKFQQDAKAQYMVTATSTVKDAPFHTAPNNVDPLIVKKQMVQHSEDEILLERIKFDDEKENEIRDLNVLDQTILLALCLDVKNTNPNDGLTAEEMGAYLSRVLDHHNNWMVYSTGLLERSWLEFERSHARERAILQMQALADQHTQRLTITQSTRESIEESAPVQDRLTMIHCLVYPPRWLIIQDLADRYASLGIVTSAAELFAEIEMWDDVVDCYRRAGKMNLAEKVVRERLEIQETPRMLSALGDILTDPSYYRKAIEVSRGRYYQAYVALGAYHFERHELEEAALNYEEALRMRPLQPFVWFRLGTISMQLERWELALKAFSEVVQQEPEEGEAWANVAAIHLRNKQPAEAYPALIEALKYNRKNWRIWVSKLYTCLDLEKYDEAIQACNILLDLQASNQASDGVPFVEAKCVRAIVGGALSRSSAAKGDSVALESSHRTLSRVYELLCRISSSSSPDDAWIFETLAFFHEQTGQDEMVLDYLMKEYRSLASVSGWEKIDFQLRKVCSVVDHISHIYCGKGDKESLTKAKFLVRGCLKTIQLARPDDATIASEVQNLAKGLERIEQSLELERTK